MFNFYLEEDKGIYHISTVLLFEDIVAGKYEAFTSTYVIRELERTKDEVKRGKLLDLITRYNIAVINDGPKDVALAEIYAAEGVIQRKYMTDCRHIAIATVHGMDMIVSMNFHHIVKRKTILRTAHINIQKGYHAVKICSPKEVMENEKKDTSDRERDQ